MSSVLFRRERERERAHNVTSTAHIAASHNASSFLPGHLNQVCACRFEDLTSSAQLVAAHGSTTGMNMNRSYTYTSTLWSLNPECFGIFQ